MTRLLREAVQNENPDIQIHWQNRAVNIAHNILGYPSYILQPDELEGYLPGEHSWHAGEIEVLMHRPRTMQLIETIGDLLQAAILDIDSVNKILEEEHPNIRLLVNRMDVALKNNDPSGVLHSSASIFETLAKDVVQLDTVRDKTLASFFDRYRKESKLPTPVLDYILNIYKQRNIEPLAGHGSLDIPTITPEQAIILSEMTKAFVRIERQLAFTEINIDTKKPEP